MGREEIQKLVGYPYLKGSFMKKLLLVLSLFPTYAQADQYEEVPNEYEETQLTDKQIRQMHFRELVALLKVEKEWAGVEMALAIDGGNWVYIDRRFESLAVKQASAPPKSDKVDRLFGLLSKNISAGASLKVRLKETTTTENKTTTSQEWEFELGGQWTMAGQGAMDEAVGKQHK